MRVQNYRTPFIGIWRKQPSAQNQKEPKMYDKPTLFEAIVAALFIAWFLYELMRAV